MVTGKESMKLDTFESRKEANNIKLEYNQKI